MVMGIAPLLVILGSVYHWFPLITGRFLNERLGKIHFWVTFIGSYSIYFPMHYLGFMGVTRRYFEVFEGEAFTYSITGINQFITVAALVTGAAQFLFIYNIIVSSKFGKKAGKNPWKACSLEWRTKDVPPTHGNFDKELPVVYRWAYDYSVPGADEDYITQDTPPSAVANARAEQT